MSKVTKRQKRDQFQDLADEQLVLPSLDYSVGRECSMHELATYAKPGIEKLLLRQRAEAMDTISKTTSDIWSQYDEALTKRSKQITQETTEHS